MRHWQNYFFLAVLLCVVPIIFLGCGRRTTNNRTVINTEPGDPPPLKMGCWYDYEWQCRGCLYYFKKTDNEVFICAQDTPDDWD